MNSLIPGDESWPEDKQLVADLATLNTQIAVYIVQALNVDAGRAEPTSVDDEQALGVRLVNMGRAVQARAARRRADGTQSLEPGRDTDTQPP